jgi:predicted DNA-binding transcriptional regulator YafY
MVGSPRDNKGSSYLFNAKSLLSIYFSQATSAASILTHARETWQVSPSRALVLETKELHWWLLSFGPEVEVVEPKTLRALMRELVERSAKRYRN